MMTLQHSGAYPFVLLTGFLGSGKTTLVNRWLALRDAPRMGILVNEFGQVGIDGRLLGPGDVVEMGGGCVCCATGSELWETALDLAINRDCTHLLVETSGIAEPSVLIEQYHQLSPDFKARFSIRNVVCVVDAKNVFHFAKERAETLHQLQAATQVIVTKTDLVDAEALHRLHAWLDQESVTQQRIALPRTASSGEVRMALDWIYTAPANATWQRRAKHPHAAQLQTVSWTHRGAVLRSRLDQVLQPLVGHVLRIKGIVLLSPSPNRTPVPTVVHLAGEQISYEPYNGSDCTDSTLVFIGASLDETALRLQLASCALPAFHQ